MTAENVQIIQNKGVESAIYHCVIEIAAVVAFYKQRGTTTTELIIQMAGDLFATRHVRCGKRSKLVYGA